MKLQNKAEFERLRIRRTKKFLRNARNPRPFKSRKLILTNTSLQRVGNIQKTKSKTQLDNYFIEIFFFEEALVDKLIIIPKVFSLETNYSETIKYLRSIYSSLYVLNSKIRVHFTNCTDISLSAMCMLRIILDNFKKYKRTCLSRFNHSYANFPTLRFKMSDSKKVTKLLYAANLGPWIEGDDDEMPIKDALPFISGGRNRKTFSENAKGNACDKIKQFINGSLKNYGFELNKQGINIYDKLITEILNNGEDHTRIDGWYVMGLLSEGVVKDEQNARKDIVGKLELVLVNFGESIYEGFEANKLENHETYEEMDSLYSFVKKQDYSNNFTRENLFSLYALQEGFSRLKYNDESRGTGTVNFLKAFIELGSYVDEKRNYKPQLNIFTGKTRIICDNVFKPHQDDGVTYLSLNKEQSLSVIPSADYVRKLPIIFPGTLLSIKVYISPNYLQSVVSS